MTKKKSKWQRREDKKNARLASIENYERLAHRVQRYINEECFAKALINFVHDDTITIFIRDVPEQIIFTFQQLYEFFMPGTNQRTSENPKVQSFLHRLDNFYQTDDNYRYFEEFNVYEARKEREKSNE